MLILEDPLQGLSLFVQMIQGIVTQTQILLGLKQ
jgi:hypothetical protein